MNNENKSENENESENESNFQMIIGKSQEEDNTQYDLYENEKVDEDERQW